MGGTIGLHSVPGEGTEFHFTITYPLPQADQVQISTVSQLLECTLKDDENLRLCKFDTLKTTKEMALAGQKTLTDVEALLLDYFKNETISLLDRLKMYNVEKKVNLLRANLDRLKSTLILILEVIKYARSVIKFVSNNLFYSASFDEDLDMKTTIRRETVKF